MSRYDSKEKRQHSSKLVPYSYYKSNIPDYFPCVPLHWHKEFEINFILNGSAEIAVPTTYRHPYYIGLRSMTENIFSCAKGNTPQLDMLMKSELPRFFWLLQSNGDIRRKRNERASKIEMIRPALKFISEHCNESISVHDLAEITHLSKSYFMSCFKNFAGIGAMEYVTQLRIKNACRLLEETNKSSAETAFECGFNNLSNFNSHFKEIVGCTPTEYRRLYRK